MRLFDHFPQEKAVCPICGTNDDKPCFLMPIDETGDDRICEAQPTHADCLRDHADQFRLNRDAGIVYVLVANKLKEEKNADPDQKEE